MALIFCINLLRIYKCYKKGVGAPVLNGSLGAIVLGKSGSGGGIKSLAR